jgi:hypothetical protein
VALIKNPRQLVGVLSPALSEVVDDKNMLPGRSITVVE